MSSKRGYSDLSMMLGILGGAALGYWLNSESGRKWVKAASEEYAAKKELVSEKTAEVLEVTQDKLQTGLDQSLEAVSQLSDAAKKNLAATEQAGESLIDQVAASYEKGVKKAQAKLSKNS